MSSIEELVDQLTRPQVSWHTGDARNASGEVVSGTVVEAPSLLKQLLVKATETAGGGGTATKARLPFSTGAVDAFNLIEQEAMALFVGVAHHERQGRELGLLGAFFEKVDDDTWEPTDLTAEAVEVFTRREPRPAPLGPEAAIIGWVSGLQTDRERAIAERILSRWVDIAREILEPATAVDLWAFTDPDTTKHAIFVRGRLKAALVLTFSGDRPVVTSRETGRTWVTAGELDELGKSCGIELNVGVLRQLQDGRKVLD